MGLVPMPNTASRKSIAFIAMLEEPIPSVAVAPPPAHLTYSDAQGSSIIQAVVGLTAEFSFAFVSAFSARSGAASSVSSASAALFTASSTSAWAPGRQIYVREVYDRSWMRKGS